MKINKAAAVLLPLLFVGFSLSAQTVEFTSELSSDVASIKKGGSYGADGTETDFAGIEENAVVLFTSERLDAGIDVTFILDDWNGRNFGVAWDDIDWFVEFRPVEKLSLGFHEDIYSDGSYLPIYDDNLSTGNFGSDGFTVIFRPIDGLSVSATAPFGGEDDVNFFSGKNEDDSDMKFNVGFGISYAWGELFSAGASVQDAADSDQRAFGIFAQVAPLAEQELVIRAGYSYSKEKAAGFDDLSISEEFGVFGENLLSAAAEYSAGAFGVAAEILANLDDKDSDYDLYVACTAAYDFTESFTANVTGILLVDNSSDGQKPVIGVNPNIGYVYGNHSFEAGINYETVDGDTFISFPLTYTYSF